MFPFTAGPPCERVLFDHSPFYGGSVLRGVAGSAKTAMLSRFASTRFNYFDAIRPMFRFTIRDVLWLMVVVGMGCGWWIEDARKYAAYREIYGGRGAFKSHF